MEPTTPSSRINYKAWEYLQEIITQERLKQIKSAETNSLKQYEATQAQKAM